MRIFKPYLSPFLAAFLHSRGRAPGLSTSHVQTLESQTVPKGEVSRACELSPGVLELDTGNTGLSRELYPGSPTFRDRMES